MSLLNAAVSAVLQLGVVLLVAFAIHAVTRRREKSFTAFVGLTRAPWKAVAIGLSIGIGVALVLISIPGVRELASGDRTVVGETTRDGISAEILSILALRALVQTSLSEELLFRGLIGRNLIRRFGFAVGNAVQAGLFGAVHLVLLLVPDASIAMVLLVVGAATTGGWVLGWINERMAGGSILPGWAAHGAANLLAYLGLALTT